MSHRVRIGRHHVARRHVGRHHGLETTKQLLVLDFLVGHSHQRFQRNLVAQGLHDSIAQGLNYLNLQVQMLDSSVRDGRFDQVAEIVPALRMGVQESYEDVRELLLNFRSRLAEDDLVAALCALAMVAALRGQLGSLQALLDESKARDAAAKVQLDSLGKDLNAVCAATSSGAAAAFSSAVRGSTPSVRCRSWAKARPVVASASAGLRARRASPSRQ